jgi:hypothetical protein
MKGFQLKFFQISLESLRVARVVVTRFIFDEIEAAENQEESSTLGEAWERENYLKNQILSFKVKFSMEGCQCDGTSKNIMVIEISPLLVFYSSNVARGGAMWHLHPQAEFSKS